MKQAKGRLIVKNSVEHRNQETKLKETRVTVKDEIRNDLIWCVACQK